MGSGVSAGCVLTTDASIEKPRTTIAGSVEPLGAPDRHQVDTREGRHELKADEHLGDILEAVGIALDRQRVVPERAGARRLAPSRHRQR